MADRTDLIVTHRQVLSDGTTIEEVVLERMPGGGWIRSIRRAIGERLRQGRHHHRPPEGSPQPPHGGTVPGGLR